MPPQDAILAYNVLPSQHGLRSRLGYLPWASSITGVVSDAVRTMLPFAGQAPNGAGDRLFAVNDAGIWDVTTGGTATMLVGFGTSGVRAGYMTWHVCTTVAGRYLLACCEENGLYIYSEATDTWAKAVNGTAILWEGSTIYEAGNRVNANGNEYICIAGGTSAAPDLSSGPSGTGYNIDDGVDGLQWNYVGAAPTQVFGPGLADQQNGFTFDVGAMVAVTVFKSRVWLVERSTTRAWYLDAASVYGECTSFDFGGKFRAGGELRNLYNWSYDAGAGLDTSLVAISSAGDVAVWQGTDPDSASTFGLKGVWSVGSVPAGRRIATEYGGDLLVLSQVGVVTLSRLVAGTDETNEMLYATRKISNLFAQLAFTGRQLFGWGLHIHPQDNALLVFVPVALDAEVECLAMSLGTNGWSRYRGMPIVCGDTWEGEFYFGSTDGKVYRNTGYLDEDTAIECSVMTAFRSMESRQAKVSLIRPTIIGAVVSGTLACAAKYDFDLSEVTAGSETAATSGWDVSVWDEGVWGGDPELTVQSGLTGGLGCGHDVAIALRWSCTNKTTFVCADVTFETGGIL